MESLKVTSNQSKRTFTIRKYDNGHVYAKYRTYPMSKEEFEDCEMNTEGDWKVFLNSSQEYFVV
jgi:hypothetical protein